jgi:hypothetical protein
MPAYSGSRLIFGYENFRKSGGINAGQRRDANLNWVELAWDLRRRAEVVRSEGVAQTEMNNASFRDNSAHPNLAKSEPANHFHEVVLLVNGEEIWLQDESFRATEIAPE